MSLCGVGLRGWAPVSIVAAFVGAVLVAPGHASAWAAKEGPVEHASHAVLLLATLGWARLGWRWCGQHPDLSEAASWIRRTPWLIAAWCGVVLGEEVEWGALYGVDVVADRVVAFAGRTDFHNAWSGHSYVVFAVPAAVLAILGARAVVRGGRPRSIVDHDDTFGLWIVLLTAVAGTLAAPNLEAQLDEVSELALYVVLAAAAWRPRAHSVPSDRCQADISKPTKQFLSPPLDGE